LQVSIPSQQNLYPVIFQAHPYWPHFQEVPTAFDYRRSDLSPVVSSQPRSHFIATVALGFDILNALNGLQRGLDLSRGLADLQVDSLSS
jgi:hypothetical protein